MNKKRIGVWVVVVLLILGLISTVSVSLFIP